MTMVVANSFNENDTATVRDYSNSLADSTSTSSLTATADTFGYYMSFDGAASKYVLPLVNFTRFTIVFEFRTADTSAGVLYSRPKNGKVSFSGGNIDFSITDGSTTHTMSTAISADTWYRVVWAYGAGGQVAYIDDVGTTVTDANTLTLLDTEVITVGNLGAAYFNGDLRELRVYSTKITDTQVISAMLTEKQGSLARVQGNPFNVGDLIAQTGGVQAVVFASDANTIRWLPMNTTDMIEGKAIYRSGHRWDTTRQDLVMLDGSTDSGQIRMWTGVTSFSDLTDAAAVMVLDVNGHRRNTTTVTSGYAATATDVRIAVDTSGGAVTVTLPASPATGKEYRIIKTTGDANAVTVAGNGNNINGSANRSLPNQYDTVTIWFDGTEWFEE